MVQRCLYSYRQRYSPSQWSKCCGFRRCSEQFASRGQKYQTCLILSSRPRKANFSPNDFPANMRKRMSKPPRDGVCSAVSSPCAVCVCQKHLNSRKLFFILEQLQFTPPHRGRYCKGLATRYAEKIKSRLLSILSSWLRSTRYAERIKFKMARYVS